MKTNLFYATTTDASFRDEMMSGIRISTDSDFFKEFLNGNIILNTRPALLGQGISKEPKAIATDGAFYRKNDFIAYLKEYGKDCDDLQFNTYEEAIEKFPIYDFKKLLKDFRVANVYSRNNRIILYLISKELSDTLRVIDLNWVDDLVNGFLQNSKFYTLEIVENGLFKNWCMNN